MELLAVRSARLIAYLNAEELNPTGRPLVHDFMRGFVKRYEFIKSPTTAEEILDPENKGITFENGKLGDVGISSVKLFDWGVAIDTNSSTESSEAILQDMLTWSSETFGLSNRPNLITRRNYVSEIVFSSDLSLPRVNPAINAIGQEIIGPLVAQYIGFSSPFEITGINLSFDSTQTKQLFTPFQLSRLIETPFSLNKYYSGAPLKTADHVKVIEQIETLLSNTR